MVVIYIILTKPSLSAKTRTRRINCQIREHNFSFLFSSFKVMNRNMLIYKWKKFLPEDKKPGFVRRTVFSLHSNLNFQSNVIERLYMSIRLFYLEVFAQLFRETNIPGSTASRKTILRRIIDRSITIIAVISSITPKDFPLHETESTQRILCTPESMTANPNSFRGMKKLLVITVS